MILSLEQMQHLAAECAPAVAAETLLAVAKAESGFDPLAIGVNGEPVVRVRAVSKAEAVTKAAALIRSGRSVDLGLAQINSRNLAWLGLTVVAAFDPCRNLAASARVLQDGFSRSLGRGDGEQAALLKALSYYNTGHPERGFRNGYVAKVKGGRLRRPSAAGDGCRWGGREYVRAPSAGVGRVRFDRPGAGLCHPALICSKPRRPRVTIRNSQRLGPCLAAGVVMAFVAVEPAFAQSSGVGGNIGGLIQNIIDILNSSVVRGLAIIAVMLIGISWMYGLIDLRRAGTSILGIIITLSASTIVETVFGGGSV